MKKNVLIILSIIALVLGCTSETKEVKVRKLVEPIIIANLPNPDSYEFVDIQIDSCFNDSNWTSDLVDFERDIQKLYKEYQQQMSDVEQAEENVIIYADSRSSSEKNFFEKHKKELEKAQYKASKTKDAILQKSIEYERYLDSCNHEFIGWTALIRYKQDYTTYGSDKVIKITNEQLLFLNKELTEIVNSISLFEMKELTAFDENEFLFEFAEDLKQLYQTQETQKE